jgi:hypothetical protein
MLVYYPSRAVKNRSEFKQIQYSDHTGSENRVLEPSARRSSFRERQRLTRGALS